MKNLIILLGVLCFGNTLLAQKTIKGTVSFDGVPLVNAEVSISGSNEIIKTALDGSYEIVAKEREVLLFSYPSMNTMEIIVEDVTRILNVVLTPEVNALDEVVVTKTVRKTQKQLLEDYYINKNLINTAFGIIDKERVSYRMKIIEGKDLPVGGIDFLSALQGRFPGLRVERSWSGEPKIFFRGAAGIGFQQVIYDVDGMVYSTAPTFIAVETIERIALISGLGATARYGYMGNGGVIAINTKNAIFAKPNSQVPMDLARLRNNYLDKDAVLPTDDLLGDSSSYLKMLRSSESEEQAILLYKEQIKAMGASYHYVLDAYNYFVSDWSNQKFADQIIIENSSQFVNNPPALKALAYTYQTQNSNKKAHEVFKEIFILRPNYAQSYTDLANSYRSVGDYQRAASIYVRYEHLLEKGFLRAEGKMFTNIIDREFNNLIALKGKKILANKDVKNFILDEEFNGTRLMFEWNDSEAEFELQFVNPENQYYNSEHSLIADANRIKDEKLSGYSSEEYLIDDSIRGTWMVNVKYFGNKSITPTYIKASIYHNYGSASQRKETKLFKMSLRNVNQQWFTVSNAGIIASN